MNPGGATSGRSTRTAIRYAQRSLPRNCRSRAGTSRSAIQLLPAASRFVWLTRRTAARCAGLDAYEPKNGECIGQTVPGTR
jgi:hypothetical protein